MTSGALLAFLVSASCLAADVTDSADTSSGTALSMADRSAMADRVCCDHAEPAQTMHAVSSALTDSRRAMIGIVGLLESVCSSNLGVAMPAIIGAGRVKMTHLYAGSNED